MGLRSGSSVDIVRHQGGEDEASAEQMGTMVVHASHDIIGHVLVAARKEADLVCCVCVSLCWSLCVLVEAASAPCPQLPSQRLYLVQAVQIQQ